MFDFSLTISSSPPSTMEIVSFQWSGGPSSITHLEWDFGDYTDVVSTRDTVVKHIYTYPGQKQVDVTVHMTGASSVQKQMLFSVNVVSRLDEGVLTCASTEVSTFTPVNLTTTFSSAYGQKVSWTRVDDSTSGVDYGYFVSHGKKYLSFLTSV